MATFTVTNLFDSGTGSLRQAIFDANAQAGLDELIFAPELRGGTINLTSGELTITDDLNISGLGSDFLTLDAGDISGIFNINDGNSNNLIDVSIDGLFIAKAAQINNFPNYISGGIFNRENLTVRNSSIFSGVSNFYEGILNVSNSTVSSRAVSNNTAFYSIMNANGGTAKVANSNLLRGISNVTIESNSSTFEVTNSTISGRGIENVFGSVVKVTDSTISGIDGSGINNTEGRVEVINSTISGNAGSGIDSISGRVEVINSTISGNAGSGIDVSYYADAYVTNSTISNNGGSGLSTGDRGGNFSVTNSTISDNAGSGIELSGGFYLAASGANVTNSTISGNAYGGISNGFVTVTNSTISGNTTPGSGGGIFTNLSLRVTNSTITQNSAGGDGGGIFFRSSSFPYDSDVTTATIENTIIAENFDTSNNAGAGDIQPDVSGEFISNGYNLIGNGTGSSGFTATGDQVGTNSNPIDPRLSPLQNNGGLTKTHALLPGSPAIDAGNPGFTPPPEFDQRGLGFDRIVDGNNDLIASVDIGAFELQSQQSPPIAVPEPSSVLSLIGLTVVGVGLIFKRYSPQ